MNTPTPDEARELLRDVQLRREQSVGGMAQSRAYWIGAGVVAAAFCVFFDFEGDKISGGVNLRIQIGLLALLVLSMTRWGSAVLRRPPVRPRRPGPGRWATSIVAALVIMVLALLVSTVHIPHIGSILGVASGLLLAVGGPWWQNRLLSRRAARP